MLAETVGSETWDEMTDKQRQDFLSAPSSIRGQMGAEAGPTPRLWRGKVWSTGSRWILLGEQRLRQRP